VRSVSGTHGSRTARRAGRGRHGEPIRGRRGVTRPRLPLNTIITIVEADLTPALRELPP
jgi:hypothetical protein